MNKKNLIAGAVIIIAILGIGMLLTRNNGYIPPEETQTPQNNQNSDSKQTGAISIKNFSFDPETLVIEPGTTVVWTNNDSIVHNIKSDSFSSPNMAKGQTFEFNFDNKGTYDYTCGIHPSMKGKIIVK